MNREIKFRARDSVEGIWIYGSSPVEHPSVGWGMFHLNTDGSLTFVKIDPETSGQFTGLYDSEGREIYEGDILNYISTDMSSMSVEFKNGCFVGSGHFNNLPLYEYFETDDFKAVEVIGNIYQGGN